MANYIVRIPNKKLKMTFLGKILDHFAASYKILKSTQLACPLILH